MTVNELKYLFHQGIFCFERDSYFCAKARVRLHFHM
jgi:hypothetical protein